MPDAIGPWRRWWRLPRAEQRIVLWLAWRLPLVDLALRLFGLRRTRRFLLRGMQPPRSQACSPATLIDAQRLAALASMVGGRTITRASCLRQALVVEQRLRRRGLPAELRIGVRKGAGATFDAHAWVELDNIALGQPFLIHTGIPGAGERLV